MRYRIYLAVLITLVSTGHAVVASAQEPTDDADRWDFIVAPYLLLPHMDGDVTIRGNPVDVDAGPGDIFERLDFGAMLYFEAANPRLGLHARLALYEPWRDGSATGE